MSHYGGGGGYRDRGDRDDRRRGGYEPRYDQNRDNRDRGDNRGGNRGMDNYNYGRRPPNVEGMVSLKVDNLSFRMTPDDIKPVFEKYGEVGDIYIPRDRYTKESRGFAFVRFHEGRDAEDAMEKLDGYVLDGREMRVQLARYGRPYDPSRGKHGGNGGRRGHYNSRRSRSRSYSRSRSPSPRRRKRSPSRSRSRSPRRRSRSPSNSPARAYSGSPRQRSRSPTPRGDDISPGRGGGEDGRRSGSPL